MGSTTTYITNGKLKLGVVHAGIRDHARHLEFDLYK